MKTKYAISCDIWNALEKIMDLPKNVTEAHIHFKINEPVIIETTQLVKTVDSGMGEEIKKRWGLQEIKND